MVKWWHSVNGPHILCSSEEGPQAEELLAVCSCIASTALVGDEAELSACAVGFTRSVLLAARGAKELDPL